MSDHPRYATVRLRNRGVARYPGPMETPATPGSPTDQPDRPRFADHAYGQLLERRIVFLQGEIKDGVADLVAAQLLTLDAASEDDVTLLIDSPGGDVSGLFVIHDTVQTMGAKVHTRCLGLAASSAAVILATGTGTRAATENSRILLHQPHGGVAGSAVDIQTHAQEFLLLKRRLEEILAERTGQPIDRIREDTDRDRWFSAEEAREYGLIDEVLRRPPLRAV
jgi:ATP-dependent Clp protease protease subunit